nr:hypothetical protein [Candidatus Woesearchaeota archaeon]
MLMDSELQEIVMVMMSPLRTRLINYNPASIKDFGNSYEDYRSNLDWFASALVENSNASKETQLIEYSDFMAFLYHYREFFGDYYPSLIAEMDNRDVDEILFKYVDLNAKIVLQQLKR